MAWNWAVFDKYLAPEISDFTTAVLPEISSRHPEREHWLFNFFLNSVLRARYRPPTDRLAGLFVRRVSIAFEEYETARAKTNAFIEGRAAGEQPVRKYVSALHHWEQCVAAVWQALDAWSRVTGQQAFEGEEERETPVGLLHHIYNASKHSDGTLADVDRADSMVLAVWLSEGGMKSADHVLPWETLAGLLEDLADVADRLQDPKSFASPDEN